MRSLLILPICLLAGCASITKGTTQKIAVQTEPQRKMTCIAKNNRGEWAVKTPGEVIVHKDSSMLAFDCKSKGTHVSHQQSSSFDPMVIGNLIFGGIPGFVIDGLDGASHQYPKKVTIPLTEMQNLK